MLNIYIITLLSIITLFFSFFRLKFLMLFFQQKEYKNFWFFKYIFKDFRLIDKKLTLCLLLISLFSYKYYYLLFLVIPLFIFFAFYENQYLKNAKKQLVITDRVKRIIKTTLFLTTIISFILNYFCPVIYSLIITIQVLPFLLILSNFLLSYKESKIQKTFLSEATEKLKKINPTVIGITGSYGKTSTKYILFHILSSNLPVLITPGSINTQMGITRIIREKLESQHKYFIVEMGAYFKGSIEKLCNFVKPKYGIITSIGEAHYEYFKTQEMIASTKFELGECTTKNNGFLVINTNQIGERFIPENLSIIKVGKNSNIYTSDIKQTEKGISFLFHRKEEKYEIFVPIFGIHQVDNIALAIEISLKLGMNINTILANLKTLPQINHRLEVNKKENNITIIDDAYNSNIEGFKSGLDLLQVLNKNRRILITPGMVELGNLHEKSHYDIGKIAGTKTDITILIGSDRIPSFVKGFQETANKDTSLIKLSNFKEAKKWMECNLQSGDIVLLENDLTDIYETRFSL